MTNGSGISRFGFCHHWGPTAPVGGFGASISKFADLKLDQGGDVSFIFKREDGLQDLQGKENRILWHIDGSGIGGEDFLVLINMDSVVVSFAIPRPADGRKWVRLIDTAAWAEPFGNFWPSGKADVMGEGYVVHPSSIVVMKETVE